ncbi:MAG: ABC transporter ATP-binding protein [Chloroflexi bacterium]|nr:ABC transporter ATP-binding protein [Chloroflexota bacterium]
MNAIRCEGLSRTYGEVKALKPLDLTVPAGSVFGFLGRNGAGKTTTIRLLTGLAHPTTGRAWINGVETATALGGVNGDAGRQFGYLPQEPAFYNWMSPIEYLDYVGRLFGLETAASATLNAGVLAQRIPELLELVGLDEVANRRIEGFSGGMKRRLGLAQALIHRPPILILDEPMAGMDPAGRRDAIDLLDSLRGETTIFFSSHILADVDRVCDTIGIIHEGELLLTAARDDLLAQYAMNAVQLEFSRESKPSVAAFVSHIEAQPWASGVSIENGGLRVAVTDAGASAGLAKQSLLSLIVEHGLVLNKYEWVRPSLEDVFLAISE